jgi:hypothetical protein
MEPDIEHSLETSLKRVVQVTTFSRYIALALLVLLPFLGAYVGYQFAPIQVVEVEKLVAVASNVKQTTLPPLSELQARFAEKVSDRLSIELLYTTTDNEVSYVKAFIPDSSACCGVYKYNHQTQRFYDAGINVDIVRGERSSEDGRYIAKVADQIFLEVYDLETQSVAIKTRVDSAETLVAETCSYAAYAHDLKWLSKNTLQYGVYKAIDLSEGCPAMELIEYRTVTLE